MPVPRIRMWYISGLYPMQPELRSPQDVVCTTDGDNLVVCPMDSYRPLVTIPLAAIKGANTVSSDEAGVTDVQAPGTQVLVVNTEPGEQEEGDEQVPEGPIIFSGAKATDVRPRVERFRGLLTPRSEEEMAQLRASDRNLSRVWAIGILSTAALVIFLLYAVTTCIDRPEEEEAPAPSALIVLALS